MQFNAIIEQDKDGFYTYVPSLQGCVSQGGTLEDMDEQGVAGTAWQHSVSSNTA